MDTGDGMRARLYPNGMRDVVTSVVQSDGVRGLYQGYGIAVAWVVLYRALHLGGYDSVKKTLLLTYRGENGSLRHKSYHWLREPFATRSIRHGFS